MMGVPQWGQPTLQQQHSQLPMYGQPNSYGYGYPQGYNQYPQGGYPGYGY